MMMINLSFSNHTNDEIVVVLFRLVFYTLPCLPWGFQAVPVAKMKTTRDSIRPSKLLRRKSGGRPTTLANGKLIPQNSYHQHHFGLRKVANGNLKKVQDLRVGRFDFFVLFVLFWVIFFLK